MGFKYTHRVYHDVHDTTATEQQVLALLAHFVDDKTGLFQVTGSGNIEAAPGKLLEEGMGYRFTIDVSAGADAAVLTITSVKLVEGLSISVNGVRAKGAGDVYKVALIPLKKGDALSVSGDAGIAGFIPDPDFMTADGRVGWNGKNYFAKP